MPTERHAVNA